MTRDRIYAEADWAGVRFCVVDTGGIVPDDDAELPANILRQAGLAIEEAQAVIWVVDARQGITPQDEELARLLRARGKRVLVAANKADAARLETLAAEFYRFGFAEVFPISAEHGNGIGEMLDALVKDLEESLERRHPAGGTRASSLHDAGEPPARPPQRGLRAADPGSTPALQGIPAPLELRLAIVGRPNVGKSSLLNRLLGEERVIVSPLPGTTRDSVDTPLEAAGQRFRIIDTAGIRRKGKTEAMAEKLSVVMARKSLERADVAIVLLDAEQGIATLDATIAGYAVEAGCSILIALNKWDTIDNKDTQTGPEFERRVRRQMKFLDWAPVISISASTGQRVQRLLQLAIRANEARDRRIPTSQLNVFFEQVTRQGVAPARTRGASRLHVQYITQVGVRPPTFVVFTAGGRPGLHFSYQRQLQNRLREEFDFFATPIRINERHKSQAGS